MQLFIRWHPAQPSWTPVSQHNQSYRRLQFKSSLFCSQKIRPNCEFAARRRPKISIFCLSPFIIFQLLHCLHRFLVSNRGIFHYCVVETEKWMKLICIKHECIILPFFCSVSSQNINNEKCNDCRNNVDKHSKILIQISIPFRCHGKFELNAKKKRHTTSCSHSSHFN